MHYFPLLFCCLSALLFRKGHELFYFFKKAGNDNFPFCQANPDPDRMP